LHRGRGREEHTMQTLTPTTSLTNLRKEMDRLFERFWEFDRPELTSLGEWAPWIDLIETKDALVMTAEVPGIEPKDIQVTLQDQVITIKGEKFTEHDDKTDRYFRSERAHGAFARSVRLPYPVEPGKVQATFKNGLLTIHLPKAPAAKGSVIPVRSE
jgi:HSP20 family protein